MPTTIRIGERVYTMPDDIDLKHVLGIREELIKEVIKIAKVAVKRPDGQSTGRELTKDYARVVLANKYSDADLAWVDVFAFKSAYEAKVKEVGEAEATTWASGTYPPHP